MLAPPTRPIAATSLSMPTLPSKLQRPVSLQRRSTLKRSIDETNLMEITSSPSKRSRVTFDSDVDIVSADEEDNLDPLVVKEQVRRAIERHRNRDNESYEKVKALFSTPADTFAAPSQNTLRIHLQALLANVAGLTKDCSDLVGAVISSEWVGRDERYCTLFVRFLNNLAAAHRGYQNKIMTMLVELLGPQQTRRIEGLKPVRQPSIHRRTLQAIQHITINVPSAPNALADRITACLEFDFQKADDRMTYIRSFMEMIKYVPELTSEILTNIHRELIKLDVSIQADLDEEEDDAEEDILQHMSSSQTLVARASQDMAMTAADDISDDITSSDDSDMEDEDDIDPVTARRRKLKEDVKQVDLIMDILFRYYNKLMSSTTLQTRDKAIDQLLSHFHSLVLPTYRSRHPQFLIFHFAQTDPVIVDRFITSCVEVLIDKRQPQIVRHSAAAYFSGFVGRGAHVSSLVVKDCLDLLCDQLNQLRAVHEPACHGPDLKRFGNFYAVFQAVLYIFCFRWRDIASASSDFDDSDIESDAEEDDVINATKTYRFNDHFKDSVRDAFNSPLNPLRICTPVIVEQFARLSFKLELFYVYSILEQNKNVRVATQQWRGPTSGISDLTIRQPDRDLSWMGDNGMLEGYFPYDPYHLPISKHWIEADYVEWQGIPGDEADESDSSDDELGGGMDMNEFLDDSFVDVGVTGDELDEEEDDDEL